MRQYGYLRAIYLSFFSRRLYRDVMQNWGAGTLLYLLMLLAICWVVILMNIQPAINLGTTKLVNEVVPQLPDVIYVKKGSVVTPENRPYVIKGDNEKSILAVIDTSGKYQSLESAHTRILVTQHEILYLDSSDTQQVRKLPNTMMLELHTVDAGHLIVKLMRWMWLLLFPVFLLGSYLYRIAECFVYAMFGKIIGCFMHVSLHYLDIVRLEMIALTPAIVLGTIMHKTGIGFAFEELFYFILSLAYLIFAINANREKHERN